MLDFEHDSLVGLIGEISRLGDDSIEAGAFEAVEPVESDVAVGGGGSDVNRRLCGVEGGFEHGAALLKGLLAKIPIALAKDVEEDAGSRGFRGEEFYTRGGGVNAELQRIEVEPSFPGNDEFAIEDTFCGELFAKRVEHLRKVAVQGFLIAALYEDVISVTKDKDAKAIPLRLIDPVAALRDLIDALGEHRQ